MGRTSSDGSRSSPQFSGRRGGGGEGREGRNTAAGVGRGACQGRSGMVGPVDRPAGLAPAPTLVSAQGLVLTADKLTRATHVAGVLTRDHVTPL